MYGSPPAAAARVSSRALKAGLSNGIGPLMVTAKNAMLNFSWNGYQPPQNTADPDTLTTTVSYEGEPYVFPWLSDAVGTARYQATAGLVCMSPVAVSSSRTN